MEKGSELPESRREHLEQVQAWLREHVRHFGPGSDLKYRSLVVDWTRYPTQLSGQVNADTDGVPLDPPLDFYVDVTGSANVVSPVFTSPLGAPASYAQYEFDDGVPKHVVERVRASLPPIRGVLWEDPPGAPITTRYPADFDRSAWEKSLGRPPGDIECVTERAKPWVAVAASSSRHGTATIEKAPPSAGKPGNAAVTLLLLLPSLLLTIVIALIAIPMMLLFGAANVVDKGAQSVGGKAYTGARDRAVQMLGRTLMFGILLAGLFLGVFYCSQSSTRSCDYGRAEVCEPAD